MKYIDSEKLIESIEEIKKAEYENCGGVNAKTGVLQEVQELIASLQQEQHGLPGINESGIPGKDFIPVEWVDACEKYGKWKIVKQEQPEVDLKKEITKLEFIGNNDARDVQMIARHFYEIGLNARKEENK